MPDIHRSPRAVSALNWKWTGPPVRWLSRYLPIHRPMR